MAPSLGKRDGHSNTSSMIVQTECRVRLLGKFPSVVSLGRVATCVDITRLISIRFATQLALDLQPRERIETSGWLWSRLRWLSDSLMPCRAGAQGLSSSRGQARPRPDAVDTGHERGILAPAIEDSHEEAAGSRESCEGVSSAARCEECRVQ